MLLGSYGVQEGPGKRWEGHRRRRRRVPNDLALASFQFGYNASGHSALKKSGSNMARPLAQGRCQWAQNLPGLVTPHAVLLAGQNAVPTG